MSEIPSAEFMVIGGGAVGCGVAYALAQAGRTDVVVLERAPALGQATTSQGAGLCGQLRDSVERAKLAMHSVATFRELQATATTKPDWNEVGSLRIALGERRAQEFRRLKGVADEAGLDAELIDRHRAAKLWPAMDFSKTTAILWCPSDGFMTPSCVVAAYAEQSRKLGVRFFPSTIVEEIRLEHGRVAGLETNRGSAECRCVINAAGAHAYHVARLAGLELPIVPVRHEYFVTVELAGLQPSLPCFRIPELTLYGRVRDGGLLLGGWEAKSLHTDPRTYELAGAPPAIEPDWPVLNSFSQLVEPLLPQIKASQKSVVAKGWPTFTPDGRFLIGESSKVPGFVMAGGCNAHGISGSGGIGKLLVESLFDPKPSAYVRSLSPDRFPEGSWNWETATRQAARVYETYYGV